MGEKRNFISYKSRNASTIFTAVESFFLLENAFLPDVTLVVLLSTKKEKRVCEVGVSFLIVVMPSKSFVML